MRKSIGPENQRKIINSRVLETVVKIANSNSPKYKNINNGTGWILAIFFFIFLIKPCLFTLYIFSTILAIWIVCIGICALIIFLNWDSAEKIRKSLCN